MTFFVQSFLFVNVFQQTKMTFTSSLKRSVMWALVREIIITTNKQQLNINIVSKNKFKLSTLSVFKN